MSASYMFTGPRGGEVAVEVRSEREERRWMDRALGRSTEFIRRRDMWIAHGTEYVVGVMWPLEPAIASDSDAAVHLFLEQNRMRPVIEVHVDRRLAERRLYRRYACRTCRMEVSDSIDFEHLEDALGGLAGHMQRQALHRLEGAGCHHARFATLVERRQPRPSLRVRGRGVAVASSRSMGEWQWRQRARGGR